MAATNNRVLETALLYASWGFSVIPLRGKVCPIRWVGNQTSPATFGQLHVWHKNNLMQNVGIVCGEVSENLAVIDLDGLDAVQAFRAAFPHLLDTYTVKTGSGKGEHLYFRCWQVPPTTRTTGFELRCDGCYVVAPPSIHPETHQAYLPSGGLDSIRVVEHLEEVQRWIAAKIKAKHQQWATAAANTPIRAPSKYGARALENACANVRAATSDRNNRLSRESYKMGFMVECGHIDYWQAVRDLTGAASHLSADDGEKATIATIKSGLNAGMERSRGNRKN